MKIEDIVQVKEFKYKNGSSYFLYSYKHPTDIAFIRWARRKQNHHPIDDEYFYVFIKTKIRYKTRKYDSYNYFQKEFKKYNKNSGDEYIENHYNKMIELIKFNNTSSLYPYLSKEDLKEIEIYANEL